MNTILVTGFEPMKQFWDINPSWEAVKLLPEKIAGADVIKLQIPVVFDQSTEMLGKTIAEVQPDAVISVGQHGGSNGLLIERIGINCDDFGDMPDNAGNLLIDKKIVSDGPDAYFCNLPIREMIANVTGHGIPAYISNSAGTYLCNHVTYFVRYFCANNYPEIISGFIHVPLDMRQWVGDSRKDRTRYFMDLDFMSAGIKYAIEAVVNANNKG